MEARGSGKAPERDETVEYEAPEVTVVGTVEALTAGDKTGFSDTGAGWKEEGGS